MSLIPGDEPPAPAPAPGRPAKLECEFCSCQLTPAGDVLRMSDKARDINKDAETIRTLKAQLEQARSDADTFKRERDEANAKLAAAGDEDEDEDEDY